MAGGSSGGEDEDPVPVNCVALIDIIFCLCIFFLCSFHFKQTEGKIDSWLPKDRGPRPATREPVLEEVRVVVALDAASGAVLLRFGARPVADEAELLGLVQASYEEFEARRPGEARVEIDAEPRVPWRAVVRLMDRFALAKLKVELAQPRP